METMTARERIITAYRNKQPDRIPVSPDISNMIPCRLTGKPFWDIYLNQNPPLWKAYLEAMRYFGIDGRFPYGTLDYKTKSKMEIEETVIRKTDEYWDVRTVYKTPKGDMASTTRYQKGNPPVKIEKPIKDFEKDFEKCTYFFPEITGYEDILFRQQKKDLGESGMMIMNIPAPGFHTFQELFNGGLQETIYAYNDYPDLFSELVKIADRYYMRMVDMAIDAGTDCIQTGGSGSVTLASPELWRELSLPTIKKITKICKEANILSSIHSCGKENYLIETCANETDLDCVNPLEIPPMGDCDLADIKTKFGNKLALQGNLHTTNVMLNGTTDTVRYESLKAILAAGIGGGFILSTGDQCGRDTPNENIFEMVRTVKEFGHYPLDIEGIKSEIGRLERSIPHL